ncbi:hypothetical protein Tco_0885993, partial [Tanacetum coccineum]
MFRIASTTTQTRTPQLPHASRNTNPHMSKSSGVIHTTSVSRPQLKCYQVKDKVLQILSQVKFTKKEVEDHHRISSISKKTKSVTACNDSSNSRTSNANAVCAECGTCVFNSNHDACVSRYLKDVSDLAPQRQEMSVENVSSGLVPQGQKASDYDNSDPVPPRQNVVPSAEKTDSSHQGLEFLFSPL